MNYQEIILAALSAILTLVIIPLIALAGRALITYINKKTENSETAELLATAINIIIASVQNGLHSYVETLRQNIDNPNDAHQKALAKMKESVLAQLPTNIKEFICQEYGSLEDWVEKQIESYVNAFLPIKNDGE